MHRPANPEVGVRTTNPLLVQEVEQLVRIGQEVSLQNHAQRRKRETAGWGWEQEDTEKGK